MQNSVLDTSAILAWHLEEQGGEALDEILNEHECYISAVNLAELVAKLTEKKMPVNAIEQVIEGLSLNIIDFSEKLAIQSGLLLTQTRHKGLSLGDRACLATAQSLQATAVTADRIWSQLDLDIVIQCIRE